MGAIAGATPVDKPPHEAPDKANPVAIFTSDMWLPGLAAPFLPYQRIERPSDGFAVSIPSNWEHAVASEADPGEWWSDQQGQDADETHKEYLALGGLLMARQASPPSDHFCAVHDFTEDATMAPRYITLSDVLDDRAFWADEDPEVIDFESALLELPAGPAAYVDILMKDGFDTRDYLFTDGSAWFQLGCWTHVAPDDRWLSIAETFEFLPVPESGSPSDEWTVEDEIRSRWRSPGPSPATS